MSDFYGKQELHKAADKFPAGKWPRLLCPRCESGTLQVRDADSVMKVEAADSASELWKQHEGWEPDWVYGYFHGVLHCSYSECGEPTIVTGEYKVDAIPDPDWGIDYEERLRLRFSIPALCIMKIPENCPKPVKDRIQDAAKLLWSDPASAANRLRSAIEELLTSQRIPRTKLISRAGAQSKRRKRLSTHERIIMLKAREPDAANLLEAVKWIGNSGSHEGSVRPDDVLNGVALLEHALHDLYDDRGKELARIAKEINARKGPVRKGNR
ncbi:DUF4145 domain-containing protein [Streptomyces fungicidicus]|uniref:DUF4145 domain-containing protein n=1 Tax=Streptomyces fungicidicus TaxID=68203 RepID=A0A494V136_9ACTN|nr:DUF4145 domain-containing protein [Streptomyces fungicidicus]AYL36581.1 hypothetical protein CNQ36_14775 [Streptomyces fungicidicus]